MEYLTVILYKYRKKNIEVVNVHTLGLLPIGVLCKIFFRAKLIYDAHEYETQTQGLKGSRKNLRLFWREFLSPIVTRQLL